MWGYVVGMLRLSWGLRRILCRSSASDKPESSLLRLPNAIVVHEPGAHWEVQYFQAIFQGESGILPWMWNFLEDDVIGKILCHLGLVPSFADDEHAVRGAAVMEKYQVFASVNNTLS